MAEIKYPVRAEGTTVITDARGWTIATAFTFELAAEIVRVLNAAQSELVPEPRGFEGFLKEYGSD